MMLTLAGFTAPAATAAEPSETDSYEITVNGQVATMTEGESVSFPLYSGPAPKTGAGEITTMDTPAVYPGNGGKITVTPSHGIYYWKVEAPCATSFLGTFSITDLTSGLGGGGVPATGFSGSAPTSKLYNHRYAGNLSGSASNPFIGTCAWTGPNSAIHIYRG